MNFVSGLTSACSRKREHFLRLSIVVFFIAVHFITPAILAQDVPTTPPTETAQPAPTGKSGRVSGIVVDAKTGEKLLGATIMLQTGNETLQTHQEAAAMAAMLGAKSNLNGEYLVRAVPPGIYTVTISMVGYAKEIVSDVKVSSDGIAKLDVSLKTEDVKLKDDIKVTAKREKGSTSANDVIRKTAAGAMDIVSSEQIGRAGVGDAQGALSKVTGVSLMGDQAYVRGISDRYLSVQLNGSTMPSSDPDKQTFRTDIVATNLLDNISVQKTYTPDQPGNFTGAAINLSTKSYPESRSLVFSGGLANNDLATGNNNFLTSTASSTDKWGYDNGYRDMPQYVRDNIMKLPGTIPYYDSANAHRFVNVLDALHNEVETKTKKAPVNNNFAISYGDNLPVFQHTLGVVASLSYDHRYNFYEDGIYQRFNSAVTPEDPNAFVTLGGKETKAKEEVTTGALATLSYSPASNHDLSFTYVRNQQGLTETKYVEYFDEVSSVLPPSHFRIHTLGYTERTQESFQFKGGHRLTSNAKTPRLDWQLSRAKAKQDEPDRRSFYDLASVYETDNYDSLGNMIYDTNYVPLAPGSSSHSMRLWRYLDETNHEGKADLTVPFKNSAKFKSGFDYLEKKRSHEEYILQLANDLDYTKKFGNYYYYDGDWEQYLKDAGGIADSSKNPSDTSQYRYQMGPVYSNGTDRQNNYDGKQTVTSWYGMVDFSPISRLKVITGARYEKTDMTVRAKFDTTLYIPIFIGVQKTVNAGSLLGELKTGDWLPSLNLVYAATEKMNFRAAYSRTLARPSLREFSPAKTYDFVRADPYIGNPNLKRSLINNFDIRWEWFTKPGEVLAVSGFYKRFKDPIELSFFSQTGGHILVPVNVTSGKLLGAEFEVRKSLGMFTPMLQSFFLGTNVTVSRSREDLSKEEQVDYDERGLGSERPLQGQPAYVVNIDFTYVNAKYGTRATLLYNMVGDQLFINSDGITPDVYEQHRPMLDFTFSQTLWAGLSLKCAAKNILDKKIVRYYKVLEGASVEQPSGKMEKGGLALYEKYPIGQTLSASLSWQVW